MADGVHLDEDRAAAPPRAISTRQLVAAGVFAAGAAALAFVPLTLDSFWGPLAYVLIGGVIVGTAITLLFVPALYSLLLRTKRA